MIKAETTIRVRYAETDQMGYVYYGNYATYYEVGRVALMKSIGMSYKELEDSGIMMPVLDYKIKYYKPAFYDDELTLVTYLKQLPKARITFNYEMFNLKGEKINEGETTLVFVNESGRPVAAPEYFQKNIAPYFS
ncbi:MAG: acyl-CoA thioesterase [Flavobacteriales bacterium]|nr:acyl-CoA thioesterase [Flavobacteriales bacterium]